MKLELISMMKDHHQNRTACARHLIKHIDSVYKSDTKYYYQLFLEECK